MLFGFIGIIVVFGIFLIVYFSIYNKLVKERNLAEEAERQIGVQLTRRYDLIPNLVEVAKGYAKHEQETLTKVIKMRNQLVQMPSENLQAQLKEENEMLGALKSVFALKESYPELKANEHFSRLEEELTVCENKIAYARQHYNKTVANYNTMIKSVPTNIVASIHQFTERPFLETPEEKKEVPKVQF